MTLRLEALPGPSPAIVRLRRLLKAALRIYGFRALEVPKFHPAALEELMMHTSPTANKFRQGFIAGDCIQAHPGGEPLRVVQVVSDTKLRVETAAGVARTIEHPWDYRRVTPAGQESGVRTQESAGGPALPLKTPAGARLESDRAA